MIKYDAKSKNNLQKYNSTENFFHASQQPYKRIIYKKPSGES